MSGVPVFEEEKGEQKEEVVVVENQHTKKYIIKEYAISLSVSLYERVCVCVCSPR